MNWDRISELRDEIGPDDFGEVVDLFMEEVEEVIDRLRQGVPLTDLEKELHFLKGSALNLGFESLSELCQDGETRSAQGAAAEVDIGPIISAYEKSKTKFLNGLDQRMIA